MFEINIIQLSGELFRTIYVSKLDNTFLEIKNIFIDFNLDKCYKILNDNDIIYTDLYDLDYDKIILNNDLTIIFLTYDKNFINKLKINGIILRYANYELQNDKDNVSIACNNNGHALRFASYELQNNYNIVKIACENNGFVLQHASESLKNNIDIVSIACRNKGCALEFASDELKNNYNIVKLACNNNKNAYQHTSNEFKNNYDLIHLVIN